MKKNILILILVQISIYSYGQFSFGVKAGINFNGVVVNNITTDVKSNIGFHAGFFGKLKVYKNFSFIPEVQFSQRGYNTDKRANLNYIEFPLLLSYSPIKLISLDLGPNVSYLISDSPLFDDKIDYGLTAGFRVNVSQKISIIGRYYYGFASNFDYYLFDQNGSVTMNGSVANRTAQIGLSYSIK